MKKIEEIKQLPFDRRELEADLVTFLKSKGIKPNTKKWAENYKHNSLQLNSDYFKFPFYRLGDISKINGCPMHGKGSGIMNLHHDNLSAIYIPRIGNNPSTSDINDLCMKHQNYIQVNISCEGVDRKYVAIFLNSKLATTYLEHITTGVIPSRTIKNLKTIPVPIPNMQTQKHIIRTWEKVNKIDQMITNYGKEILFRPLSSTAVLERIDNIIDIVGELTLPDQIALMINKGENDQCEFKSTVSRDIKLKIKRKELEHEIVKTLIGFLNKKGGVLLVGVSDNGDINGLNEEIEKHYKKNKDKFKQHFTSIIKNNIGPESFDNITYTLVNIDGKEVLHVDCKAAKSPTYDKKTNTFYLRTDPATIKLDGPELNDYIQKHFYS